jgi:CheY-like chemotaxis protein
LEAMGQLTAGMAHDFNNLLTVVIGNLSLLGDLPANGARRRMAQALSAAEHGASLTKQLLAFSRKQTLERRVVNVNTLIAGTMPLLRQAVGPLVALDIRSAEGDLAIAVDSAQMELVLLNLALNGRDAMPEGGRLTIATELHRATKDDPNVAPGDWVVIAVSDTGAGMTPTVAARAFEPFFTTKAASTGSGLGLSVVYGVIKQLGGEIALTSEPGKGTTVRIFLPRVPADAVPVERPSTLLSSAMEGARVLIVDDNPEVLDLMSAIMKEAGYEVATAASGRAAVDIFGDGRSFDLVIIDYAMPEMKGTAAARAMAGQRPDVPFLLVSGFADAVPPEEWAADQILPKPFRPGDLRARAQKLIDRAHSASAQPG